MSGAAEKHSISPDFTWSDEYDTTLDRIASTDNVETEWLKLRDILKYKIDKNIASFLADAEKLKESRTQLPSFSSAPSTSGGLKLPPFEARERDESNPNEALKAILEEGETKAAKQYLYAQIDSFDGAPFTIQRLCDLCVRPREHYKYVGKYIRALEKNLYVTSTWDSFPPLPPESTSEPSAIASTALGTIPSAPNTPLFSPIPFLHTDARRSKSRSPPPSPLALNSVDPAGGVPVLGLESTGLGLVDEMDDPRPGHMSDHPTALSSVTSVGEGSSVKSPAFAHLTTCHA